MVMTDKPKKTDKEKPQIERFKEAAKVAEADESHDSLQRAFARLDITKEPKRN
jgi:hypothetical protein